MVPSTTFATDSSVDLASPSGSNGRLARQSRSADVHQHAVETVIRAVSSDVGEPWTLTSMARVANFSAFHFNRMFMQVVGISPRRFLLALRIDAAKRLLVSTDLSITEICFDVGYTSVGTFTSQFSRLVGRTPSDVRRLRNVGASTLPPHTIDRERPGPTPVGGRVTGVVSGPTEGVVIVGLFADRLPAGRPLACAVIETPGPYAMAGVATGRYFVHAVGLGQPETAVTTLIGNPDVYVGSAAGAVVMDERVAHRRADISLRPIRPTDPPILTSIPHLTTVRSE